MVKAGGSWKQFTSLNDPAAEKLANAIFQAADAEARVKTGAAINNTEIEEYFNKLVTKTGTIEGTLDRINTKRNFFKRFSANLEANKAIPREARPHIKSDPLGLFK